MITNAGKPKLSDLLAAGMKLTRPATPGHSFYLDGKHKRACPICAAATALGWTPAGLAWSNYYSALEFMRQQGVDPASVGVRFPAGGWRSVLSEAVVLLYDNHGWSRRRIRNWLRKEGL